MHDFTATHRHSAVLQAALATGYPGSAAGGGIVAPVESRLSNGARVLVCPTPTFSASKTSLAESPVAIELWVMAGTESERPDEHGCAHLLEHLVFKPAHVDGSSTDIASAIESLGGDVNAFTSQDETVFHATVPAGLIDRALGALLLPIAKPKFDPTEVRREISVVLEEINQYDDDLASRVHQDLMELLYAEHGYGRPVLGRRAEVAKHDASRLAAFHHDIYTADRLALVVVGPLEPGAVHELAEQMLGGMPSRGRGLASTVPTVPAGPRVRVRTAKATESHIAMAWMAPILADPDAVALDLVSVALGHGEASRLSMRTRRGDQLVTDAHASFCASRWGCSFTVSANTTVARTEQATLGLLEQVDELRHLPIDETELERARRLLRSDVVYRRETVQGLAHAIGYQLSLGGDLAGEARYFETLERLTADDLRQACARYLHPGLAAVNVLLPDGARSRPLPRRIAGATRKVLRAKAATRPPVRRHQDGDIEFIEHPSGLRIRALVNRSVPVAAGWLVWSGGLRIEAPRDVGASPLIASLLTRGAGTLDGDALAAEVEGLAAVLEGFAGRNSAGMHFECLAPGVPTLLRRMIECAREPWFDDQEFDEERRIALEDLVAEQDDPGTQAFQLAFSLLYKGHAFGRRRQGSQASLERLTAERLRKLWSAHYPLDRAVLGLCGDVDVDGIVGRLDALLPTQPRSTESASEVSPPRYPARPRSMRVHSTKQQAHFVLAFPGIPLADPRLPTLEVLVTVLGGQAGRLFAALREREGLVYNVSVSTGDGFDCGHVAVYAATSHDKLERALAAVRRELNGIAEVPPLAAELERAKSWLVGQHVVELQRRSRVASHLAFDEVYGLGAGRYRSYVPEIHGVTGPRVQQLAQELFLGVAGVEAIVTQT